MSLLSMAANIALPGSGTVMNLLRRFGPYILIVVAAVGAYWWADMRGRSAQKAKDDAQITYLKGARDGWRRNAVASQNAVALSNASIRAEADAADAKVKASHVAAVAAQRRAAATQGTIDRLVASASQKRATGQECVISDAVKGVWSDGK